MIMNVYFSSKHAYIVNCVYVCYILYVVNYNQRDIINCSNNYLSDTCPKLNSCVLSDISPSFKTNLHLYVEICHLYIF